MQQVQYLSFVLTENKEVQEESREGLKGLRGEVDEDGTILHATPPFDHCIDSTSM